MPLINIAQEPSDSIQKAKKTPPEIEKIYLHTDNNYYTVGESLWYKAYSVYAYTNQLFDHSKILYVELLSPESKIISRNITNLEGGLGHGDFILADSLGIKPGTYQLRAYTNWMRNYGDDFVFKKEIQIITPNKENVILSKENDNTKTVSKSKKDYSKVEDPAAFLIDFFPEGGSLVEEVISNVAFKATDFFGNPIDIKGTVYNSNDKPITLFKSIHDGMGKFILLPEKNQKYYAIVITPDNDEIKINLPEVQKTGYTLSMNSVDNKKVVSIKTNTATLTQNPDADLTLICTTRGITYFEGSQTLKDTKLSFILPEENFPEGIVQITLYDKLSRPQSERLVYIEKNNAINVSLSTDKKQYAPKEKINLSLSAKDKQGNPLIANFSIAATDTNGITENFDHKQNICSYFLMASDIKGKVHNPNYYFNYSNPARLFHLDLLLLTQGWRDFVWKNFPNLNENQNFKVEKGISITGKVENLFGTTAKENNQVQMTLLNNKATAMLNDTTDVNGKFAFNNIDFKGTATMLLNTTNQKGKNSGEIVLDSIYNQPIAVDFKAYKPLNEEENKITQIKTSIRNKNILFNIPEENQLRDVIITAKKKKDDTTESRYGFADFTYIPEENRTRPSNIFILLQIAIPNLTATANSVRFNRYNGPALILVDGIETDINLLSSISTDDIAKIEAIKGPGAAVFGSQGANGALIIYTKLGKGSATSKKVFHSIAMPINGYQNTRFFYSPDYSQLNPLEKDKADIRNTLYWNPYIQPDEKGNTTISYYNNEVDTTVNIDLEGITNNGIPIVVKSSYQIKK
ncbi:TonB-dependent receptor plug domain-containing protein [Flavobacterium sp. FZUC8N2.13]|uniref:TonB-dependent receptor plug domain-containing protein n=1 Tax=Flavobacterium zubiriense TaxID=3138075 RepID=A0ABV4THU8_9FLAO